VRIVTDHPFTPEEVAEIIAAGDGQVELVIAQDREELLRLAETAEVLYGTPDAEILARAGNVRWVQGGAAGVEALGQAMRGHPAVLTNFAGTFAPAISETALGMLICLTRGINRYYVPQFLRREWKPVGSVKSDHYTEVSGMTMGIVGLGGIGTALARRAFYGFDMRLLAIDARPRQKPHFVAELREPGWLMEMVPQVDVLVAAAPHTPQTDRMFHEGVFRAMKPSAYFLALSRGKLFDDLALVKALQEGWIAGAGLDVFPQEPPPSDHPIFHCPNVVMTMHTSGWGPPRQRRLIALFAENVRRYVRGLPLLNVVDKEQGY
jgi:phosphoglycerate dehydrogenase-like enzyme